jgi:serine phosphatase RsbU (regulator of sigma subunit)
MLSGCLVQVCGKNNLVTTTHILEPDQPTTFYLFTDGFADQFGGPKGKKFKYSQLKEYLLECSPNKLSKQGILLENRLEEWKGNLEQVDDVCIIGLQIDWSQRGRQEI